MVTQNRPYDDRKVWVALRDHGITLDTFDDLHIEIIYDDGQSDHAGATVHASFVWTATAKDVTAALDASDAVSDDEIKQSTLNAEALVPPVETE